MLKEAVAYYNSLLEDSEVAAESYEILQRGLEKSRLIFGGRPLSPYLRPHFVTAADFELVKFRCTTLWGALQKVKEAAILDDSLLDELGFTDFEKELVMIDPGYSQVSPTARFDSFLTDDAYSFVELNGESPAGIAFSDSASEIFQSIPAMRRFAERYDVQAFDGRSKMLEVLLSCWEEYLGKTPDRKPLIAIVDLQDRPTVKEFELFRDYFEGEGCRAVICSPADLEFDGSRLKCEGETVDIVYKRLLVNEYLPVMDEQPDLINAYRAGAVCMVNSFRGKLVHKKAIFAVLTNERYANLFAADELEAIRAHVPWTRMFRDENTEHNGETVDLVEWTRQNAHRLVLKPNDDYGGHGIYIGWNVDPNEWDDAITDALDHGDYLIQERVRTARETFPMILDDEGTWSMVEQLVDLDPLLFNGEVGSAFTRLSSTELANVSSGGGMVPTFVIEKK